MTLNARRFAPIVLLVFASVSAPTADEKVDPRLAQIHTVFVEKAAAGETNDKVSACLADKLKEHSQLTPADSADKADAVLKVDAKVPNAAKRNMLGPMGVAVVHVTVATPAGDVIWKGENKYKKGSAVWGGATDIECGLANGIGKSLADAIDKAKAAGKQ